MHADEARKISERNIANNLAKVFAAIKEAAEDELMSVTVNRDIFGRYPDDIVKELQSKSYKAEYKSDQRDGDYIQISW